MPPALAELSPTSTASRNRATFPRSTSLLFTWASVTTIRPSTGLIEPTRSATTASFISPPNPWLILSAPSHASRNSSQRSACTDRSLKNGSNRRFRGRRRRRGSSCPWQGSSPLSSREVVPFRSAPEPEFKESLQGGAAPLSEISERGRVGARGWALLAVLIALLIDRRRGN